MSLARRSRAVKMMVSTKRTTGLTVVSRVRRSPEIVSSVSSSSWATCKVNASVACSRTRCAFWVRVRGAFERVGDLTRRGDFDRKLLAQQQRQLIAHLHLTGVGGGDGQHVVVGFQRPGVAGENQ